MSIRRTFIRHPGQGVALSAIELSSSATLASELHTVTDQIQGSGNQF